MQIIPQGLKIECDMQHLLNLVGHFLNSLQAFYFKASPHSFWKYNLPLQKLTILNLEKETEGILETRLLCWTRIYVAKNWVCFEDQMLIYD